MQFLVSQGSGAHRVVKHCPCVCFLYISTEETGGFFPNFKKETGKFLQVCPDETKQWLQRLRKEGKVLFLMTSSYVDFAQASLEYIFG